MKYELGDRVRIKKHWKRRDQSDQLKKLCIDDLETYLRSDDMAGDTLWLDKYHKNTIDETGLIVGIRAIKVRYSLWHDYQDSYETGMGMMPKVDTIGQESAEYEKVYLVATRMNCLRRVSFEDIEYVGGS